MAYQKPLRLLLAAALRGAVAGEKEAGEAMALANTLLRDGVSNVGLGLRMGWRNPLGAFTTRRTASRMLLLPHDAFQRWVYQREIPRDIARAMG